MPTEANYEARRMRLKHPSESWSEYCEHFLKKIDRLVFDEENAAAVIVHEKPPFQQLTHIGQVITLEKRSLMVYTLNQNATERRGAKLLLEMKNFPAVCEEFLFGACYLVRLRVRSAAHGLEMLNAEWFIRHMWDLQDPLDPTEIFENIKRDNSATSRSLKDWHIDACVAGRIAAALYLGFPDDRHHVALFLKHNTLPKFA